MTIYWRHILVALSTMLFVQAGIGGAAHAAPLQPTTFPCKPDTVPQADMAGTYESRAMYVEVLPCSVVYVTWMNLYGEHTAVYFTEQRLPSGGLGMSGYIPDDEMGMYLDAMPYAALTPAEPGWVKLTTISEDWKIVRTYRLQKSS